MMVVFTYLTQLLEKAIVENPPIGIKEGGIIKDGYNETLDEYRYVINHGKNLVPDTMLLSITTRRIQNGKQSL